ncbi:non-hydrolyzing UDP-N-acetylglucosamine 2-epimerase [Christiangramia aquimixticola]|uniref:non-hydrolyzing UDP-N-acetylglucosamine 2-epimerase n=1 Tax=Christiangramia aquimixticola TaxID=1697558 RepID=UPI003AA8CD12
MVPVILEMRKRGLEPVLCTTAQHREMLDQMLEGFSLKPDFDLSLMKPGQSLNGLSSAIFSEIDKVFDKVDPEVVLVQGDTTTANIIAQAAFHRQIKVAHIEAGLRTYQKYSPFPEEINRQLISRLANWHFTPTTKATQNLLKEGVHDKTILQTGNTVVDALGLISGKIDQNELASRLNLNFTKFQKLILVTGHRRENFGEGMEELFKALLELARDKKNLIVFPVHLNPEIKLTVEKTLQNISNIRLLPPVSYPELIFLLKNCDLVISDSGGIQEEAPTFKKPVLVTRDFTERAEAVEAGFSILTGANSENIINQALKLLGTPPDLENIENPFGDGKAAKRIVDFLESHAF